jgi:hypothetical protein
MLMSKTIFIVVRGVLVLLLLLKEVGSLAKKGRLWFCR